MMTTTRHAVRIIRRTLSPKTTSGTSSRDHRLQLSFTLRIFNIFALHRDLRRWTLTSRAIRRFGISENDSKLGDAVQPISTSKMEYSVTLDHISGRPFRILHLTVAIAGYGGIHILAWNHSFPSTLCEVVWRCSTVFLTAVGVAQSFRGVTMTILQARQDVTARTTKTTRLGSKLEYYTDMLNLFKVIAFDSPMYGYAIAGLLIWVVCFIDFAHLPPEAFLDISWSKFIPHFA